MKKTVIIATLSALLALPALAEEKGGFKNDEAPPPPHQLKEGYRGITDARSIDVKQAKEMHDGASVTLRGYLIKKKGDDVYQFRDKGGDIDVMIPHAVFQGKEVSPHELVGISGTLDKKQQPYRIRVTHFQKE
ncbi:YdeI family stress tolerance OB fold protein [Cronobacter sakazakii]